MQSGRHPVIYNNENFAQWPEYTQQPAQLLQDLHQRLLQLLADYKKRNAGQLNERARICLAEYLIKSNFIVLEARDEDMNDPDIIRLRIQQLSGYIYHLHNLFFHGNAELVAALTDALGKQVVEEDLAKKAYFALMLEHAVLDKEFTPEELPALEYAAARAEQTQIEEAYWQALEKMRVQISWVIGREHLQDDLHRACKTLYITILRDETNSFQYRTELLTAATNLLTDVTNPDHHAKLAAVAGLNNDGKASPGKVIAGAALIFLGIAAIAAIFAVGVLTASMALVAVPGVALLGAFLIATGIALIRNGVKHDTEKALADFQKTGKQMLQQPNRFSMFSHETKPLLDSTDQHPSSLLRVN